uniref:C2H2-type domain-containing protein n=1 Tax=Trichobilharzia regenti TaxID=157069 RepID=A0AA85IP06_TRIRE|nr:unnamed protein product [Trichobilharzia regenti]
MSERSWNSIKQGDCKIEVGTVDVIKPKSPTEAKEKNQVGKSVVVPRIEENVCLSFLNFARIQFQRGQCKYSRLQLRVCPHSFTQSGHILMSERSWNSIKQEDCKIEVGTVDVIKPKSPTEAKEKNQVGKSVVVPRIDVIKPKSPTEAKEKNQVGKSVVVPRRVFCRQCDKNFAKKSHLDEHIRVKHEDIGMKCEECGERFTYKSDLDKHYRAIHTNLKYNCDYCEQTFSWKATLYEHKRSAHKGVYFQCDECELSFVRNWNLEKHKREVHDGEKFNCPQCDKMYSTKNFLNQHVQVHHKGVYFSCSNCDQKYATKYRLNKHMKRCIIKKTDVFEEFIEAES